MASRRRRTAGRRLTPRPVVHTVEDLVADAATREPLASDGKSGAMLETVAIGDERFVLKHVDVRRDWIMRQIGDRYGHPITIWSTGVLGLVPDCIDHCYVGAAHDGRRGAILMRDAGPWLVPDGAQPISLEQHLRFLDHLAALHAACWGWRDTIGLLPLGSRYCFFSGVALACERELGYPSPVPRIAAEGWERLPDVAPRLAEVILPLRDAPWPLVDALAEGPHTFLHGDWKLGNLGSREDGRTVLLDWAMPGAGPPVIELAHYLALNAARLPPGHSKHDAIAAYRGALARHGVDTEGWFDRQLGNALAGVMVQLGWEKALGSAEELAWWEDQVLTWAAAR